jgi:D-lactate dehydrogenase
MDEFRYDGMDTCAADGLCEIACPVNINTGTYIKSLRHDANSNLGSAISKYAAKHFAVLASLARFGLSIGHTFSIIMGNQVVKSVSKFFNRIGLLPLWNEYLPRSAEKFTIVENKEGATWVYYPSCLTRVFSSSNGNSNLVNTLNTIATRTGISLRIPEDIHSTCCSQVFSSKGYEEAANNIQEKTIHLIWESSNNGVLPILVDTSPCTYQFLHPTPGLSKVALEKLDQLKFVDIIQFLSQCIADKDYPALNNKIVLHPTCSTEKMGDRKQMVSLAEKCTKEVIVPIHWGCCGFAGDRGLIVPELNQTAMIYEANDVQGQTSGYSTSRTCEVGMMSNTELNYISIAYLVKEYLDQAVN